MSVTNAIRSKSAAVRELRAVMQGNVVQWGDDGYARAREIWNGAVQHQPALFAVCETSGDVQAAVRSARAHGLPLSVRGGAHDWAGRALRHDGLVIDLSPMRQVHIDPVALAATVQGGATAVDVISAADPHGLSAATGNCGSVGMVELTIGGGYGPLTPRYGLALDNLLGAEVVLADGRLVKCDAQENPGLFWALRGGGGNFGVVTSMRVGLHRIRELLAGMIMFSWSAAESVLYAYSQVIATAPDELSVLAGVLSDPNGSPLLFLAPMWSGEGKQGEEFIAELRRLGKPVVDQIAPMTYLDWLQMFESAAPAGRHYAAQTRSLRALTVDVISTLVNSGNRKTSPFSGIIVHHFRGAATRVPLAATAFGLRAEHFMVEIIAAWDPAPDEDSRVHRQWAQNVAQHLGPHALPGGYPNMLAPDEHQRAAQAYGENLCRLQRLKQLFDPDGVFTSAICLPLQRAA